MNSLPPDFNLNHFVGSKVNQICIDEFQIQILFDEGNISGGGSVKLIDNEDIIEVFNEKWITTSGLESVIGSTIEKWGKLGECEFYLVLEGGVELLFTTEIGPYEDFTVSMEYGDMWIL